MKAILTILVFLFLASIGTAQSFVLQGRVLDEDGQTLPGATVFAPAESRGFAIGPDGQYSLELMEIPEIVIVKMAEYFDDTVRNLREIWPPGQFQLTYDVKMKPLKAPLDATLYDPAPITLPIREKATMLRVVTFYGYVNTMDRLTTPQMQRTDQSSVEQGLNLVPGVKFESRGPGGSRRLAIRGSFLRSQFGVRDVKAYINDAPLTSPDGSTALELIDAVAIARIDILKGPCASEFGPVSNGVAQFDLRNDGNQLGKAGGMLSQTVGAYGYLRSVAQLGWATSNDANAPKLGLSYVHQQYAGYRDQEANAKDFLQLTARKGFGKHLVSTNLMLYQGFWELPGSLDSVQVATDPRQALAISKALDAHVARRHLRVGVNVMLGFRHEWGINTRSYIHLSDKENPFGTSAFNQGYKVESSLGAGSRAILVKMHNRFFWSLGGEYQAEGLDFKQYDNQLGKPGPLNTRSKTLSTQTHAFTELETRGTRNFYTGQVGLSKVVYNQSQAWSAVEAIPIGKTQLSPTLAGTLMWGHNTKSAKGPGFFLRAASAYSPPALWEMTDTLGQLRSDLKPETGINFEWRGFMAMFQQHLQSQLNIYHHSVFNTIVPQNLNNGRTLYENQGRTTQIGLEGSISHKMENMESVLRSYALVLTGAYQYYYFNDYSLDGVSFNGKMIPGVPRYTINLQGDLDFSFHTSLQVTGQVLGKSFLDNANTVFQPTYCLLNLKLKHQIRPIRRGVDPELIEIKVANWSLTPFAGLNNILNTRYTNFPQLNAIAGRYYNPAPGINWFGGLDFNF